MWRAVFQHFCPLSLRFLTPLAHRIRFNINFSEPIFDPSRTFRFFSIYVFFAGPLNLGWLLTLNRFGLRPVPAVFADQFVFYPFLLTAIVALAAYGKALQADAKHLWNRQAEFQLPVMTELIAGVVADLPELMPKAWCWWIPAQLVIFSYVPILYRLTAVMCASYCWNLYLSFEINSEKKKETA